MVSRSNPSPMSDPQPRGAERRQHLRARAEWPITIRLEDGEHEAKLRDVSRGGICFFLDRPIPEMTMLQIAFDLPVETGKRQISGVGVVVRSDKISQALDHYEIAVFMQQMADPDRETIEEYVSRFRSSDA